MDKYIAKFKEFFLKFKTKKVVYVKDSINPARDWNIFISFSLLTFIVGFIFSFYFYNQVNSGKWFSKFGEVTTDRLVRIDQILLDKNILELDNKQAQRESIGKDVPSDPSI